MTGSLLAVIPARGQSKRLPHKNLMPLGGASLLAWTVAGAHAALPDAPVLLTTDDENIAAEGRRLGASVPFLRPAALATDAASTVGAVLHALDWWCAHEDWSPDLLILLQPTSPFRPVELVREGIDRMTADADADALISVTSVHVRSGSIFAERDGYLVSLDPDQTARRCVIPTGALYVIRPAALRQYGTFVPARTVALTHSGPSALDIDTPDDWAVAEAVVAAGLVAFPGGRNDHTSRSARA